MGITDTLGDIKDDVSGTVHTVTHKAKGVVHSVEHKGSSALHSIEHKASDVLDDVENLAGDVKSTVSKALKALAGLPTSEEINAIIAAILSVDTDALDKVGGKWKKDAGVVEGWGEDLYTAYDSTVDDAWTGDSKRAFDQYMRAFKAELDGGKNGGAEEDRFRDLGEALKTLADKWEFSAVELIGIILTTVSVMVTVAGLVAACATGVGIPAAIFGGVLEFAGVMQLCMSELQPRLDAMKDTDSPMSKASADSRLADRLPDFPSDAAGWKPIVA
jgi:uncharacterized protein YukE